MARKWTTDQIIEQHRGWTAARKAEPYNPFETTCWRYGHRLYTQGKSVSRRPVLLRTTLSQQMAQIEKRSLT